MSAVDVCLNKEQFADLPASNRYKEYKVVVVVGKREFGGKVGFVQL